MPQVIKYIRSQENPPSNVWQFLFAFLRTKEGRAVLIGLFIIIILLMIISPETIMKLKIAFWNFLLQKMK